MINEKKTSSRVSTVALNERRRLAVRLRISGMTLAEAAKLSDLSTPTVLSAMRAFEAGGWDAIDVRKRGRDAGSGKLLSPSREIETLDHLATETSTVWTEESLRQYIHQRFGIDIGPRTISRYLIQWGLKGEDGKRPLAPDARTGPFIALLVAPHEVHIRHSAEQPSQSRRFLVARDTRSRLSFIGTHDITPLAALDLLVRHYRNGHDTTPVQISLGGYDISRIDTRQLGPGVSLQAGNLHASSRQVTINQHAAPQGLGDAIKQAVPKPQAVATRSISSASHTNTSTHHERRPTMTHADTLTHLQRLEAESIHIMREVVAEAENPVMLYSIGKDSAVMLHLARKAFYPSVPPFPLLHVDTRWKFRDMYAFRDHMAQETGMDLLVHINPEGVEKDINPFTHGSAIHTDIMKTEGLKQALDKYGFDAAFGGARRDEEKSRAKERVFSFRSAQHRWDPKSQRPELWKLYNARKHKGESMRVFPISNWTELDIWQYIYLENIPIVPLYYSAVRPVVERDGALIMVDDERMPLKPGEVPMMKKVRFRTLGCYPLTGAIESDADTLPAIIQEMLLTKTSERQGRVIDHDSAASMEKKKQEGYF
ncbi:sulfate adenylyltransferase subunit CysD [Azoarcus communis]|nr:sulfate adenylyltransferase subunit CysD [Parazoarcus communis]